MNKNSVQLITYVDRLSGAGLSELRDLLQNEMAGLFGGIHLLPFFDPIDGQDAGFDPIDHTRVDPRLGDWDDVGEIARDYWMMADVIVNHMSAQSAQFVDFLEKGDQSEFHDLFLTYDRVFPDGARADDLLGIYRPRPGFPFTAFRFSDGSRKLVWTTFTSNQVDIDVRSAAGVRYLHSILGTFQQAGIRLIRLDAAGYAIKKPGSSCFMIPETFDFIAEFERLAGERGMEVLVEIHSHYQTQIEIARRVGYVYDFALPVLVLDCIYNRTASRLKHWLEIRPSNAVTVLDTHDGIGIVDVASEGDKPGLIPDEILDQIVHTMHERNQGRSRKATGAAASNLDLYQVNCTYFEALGRNVNEYLLARALQFFVPGIPQVYYVGLFGDDNDMELLARTAVGRDINRHYYSRKEIQEKLKSPLVVQLAELIKLRSTHPAFDGEFSLAETPDQQLIMEWRNDQHWSRLDADLSALNWRVDCSPWEGVSGLAGPLS